MTTAKLTSLTYGVLPSRALFGADFRSECPDGFRVSLGSTDTRTLDRSGATGEPIGVWSEATTWNAVTCLRDLWERGDDAAGDLASTILQVLGFEWI